jgi:hypothetical protein
MMLTRASRTRFFAAMRTLAVLSVVLSLFLSLAPPAAFAAGGLTGNLSGIVHDTTGAAVSGATVTLSSPSGTYKQTTDGRGHFTFLGVQIDTYLISVEAKGFEPVSRSGLTITGDITSDLGIVTLSKTSEPRIIGGANAHSLSSAFQPTQTVPQFTIAGSVLTAAQGKQASASETDVLLAAPGFQQDKSGNLILEGSTTDQVHFFFDGVDFTDPGFNRNGNNYFFNGISSTQIVPGAGDPSQGDSGAGAVNLVVKRGTYPGSGLLDGELLDRPFMHQFNFQYGIATKNNMFSDYVSYFRLDRNFQYGPWGTSVYDNNVFYNAANYQEEGDFVNNFVFRFGKDQNQSLQFLYYNNTLSQYDNVAGVNLPYDNLYAPTIGNVQAFTAAPDGAVIPANIIAQLIRPESGQLPGGNTSPCCGSKDYATQPDSVSNTSLVKFEYDNQLNATTSLNLRYFHSDILNSAYPVGAQENFPNPFPLAGQTAGGSRTGGIFELTKEADEHNLLTLSGNVEDARPNFGSVFNPIGLESLGENLALFVRPANPNEPVSSTNQCPISTADYPGACFLQQYYYKTGGTPSPPSLDLNSQNLQKYYGLGLRDQITVNSKWRVDLGVRYDLINQGFGPTLYDQDENIQPVPGSPSTYYVADYGNVEQPHFIEPRLGTSFKIDTNDSVAFTYGKSINETGSGEQASPNNFDEYAPFANIPITPALANAFQPSYGIFGQYYPNNTLTAATCYPQIPFPVGATASSAPSYAGSIGKNLQFGKPCSNLGELLYFNGDAYYPEVAAVVPAVFENYDFNYSHQFSNGSAVRIAPFFRQGKNIQVATAPLIYNPVTGVYSFGSLVNQPGGKNTTTGVNLQYTLPDRKYGLTGFVSATYVNEFTNTPPAGDNPYGQDFEPYVLPQSYATGDLYRAGFVSPFTANLGLSYKLKSGFRVNPIVHFNVGYPYNAGLLTPIVSSLFGPENVPNTNLTNQFGPAGSPQFVDPANPGDTTNPIIAATRGAKETPSGGGLLSRPQITADLTLEYTPPNSRATFGVQVQNLLGNEYFGVPAPNIYNYYPVTTGVAGPLTGQNTTGLAFPGLANVVSSQINPYGAYTIPSAGGAPTNFRFYFQYAL